MELFRSDASLIESAGRGTLPQEPAKGTPVAAPVVRVRTVRRSERVVTSEETLVPDLRAMLSPAASVEKRLTALLKDSAMPASHLRLVSRLGRKP